MLNLVHDVITTATAPECIPRPDLHRIHKEAGAPERGILGPTEYLFMDFFRLKENQEYRSLKEKQKI